MDEYNNNSTLSDGMDLMDVVMFACRRANVVYPQSSRHKLRREIEIRRSHGIVRDRHADNDIADTVYTAFVLFISGKSRSNNTLIRENSENYK